MRNSIYFSTYLAVTHISTLRRQVLVVAILGVSSASSVTWGVANGGTGFGTAGTEVCTQDNIGNVACGANSTANGIFGGSTAIGASSKAPGAAATAIGDASLASGAGSVATGFISTASGDYSTAIGDTSHAVGNYSTANGYSSTANGFASIDLGMFSNSIGNGDIAAGGQATTAVSSGSQTNGNIAIGSSTGAVGGGFGGTKTTANGGNSIAIGTGTQATGNNSVALGAGSTDGGVSNVFSVGSSSQTRSIINVTVGSLTAVSTDAVNGSQLFTTNQNVTTA